MKLGHWSLWLAILLVMAYAVAQNPLPPAPDQREPEDAGEAGEDPGKAPFEEKEFDRVRGDEDAGRARGDDVPSGPHPPAAGRRRPVPPQHDPGDRRPLPPHERPRDHFRDAEGPGPEGDFGPRDRGPRGREEDFGSEDAPGPRRDPGFRPEGERGPRPHGARPPFDRHPPDDPHMRGHEEDLEALRQRDPKMADLVEKDIKLERASMELAEQFRRAGPDRQEEIRRELTELVTQHFDVRQQRRELEIERFKEQLERLQASLKRRAESKETVIRQRVAQLLGEDVIDF